MKKIHIRTIDAIANGVLELEILTYLQALTFYDENAHCIGEKELEKGRANALGYLWDLQLNTLAKLKGIVDSDEFAS